MTGEGPAGAEPSPDGFDVFLSHNTEDKSEVRKLKLALEQKGLRAWLDEDELVPGTPWQSALEDAIEASRSAAVLIGSNGIGPWHSLEMRACLTKLVTRGLPVIPVLLPGAPEQPGLPLFLEGITWIDFRANPWDRELERLVWGITGKKPTKPTPSPYLQADGSSGGVAIGKVATSVASVHELYAKHGAPVILKTASASPVLPFDKIAAVMFEGHLPSLCHLAINLRERGIPYVSVDPKAEDQSSPPSSLVFEEDFIRQQQADFESAVAAAKSANDEIPERLLLLLFSGLAERLPENMADLARQWGPTFQLASRALPLAARALFDDTIRVCRELCGEYQWPVGRQMARSVLPRLAVDRPEATITTLREWWNSGDAFLQKSVSMAVGNLLLMDEPLGHELLPAVLDHEAETVRKEAARIVPLLAMVDPSAARDLAQSCVQRGLSFAAHYLVNEGTGLPMSGLPGILHRAPDVANGLVARAIEGITRQGLNDDLNMARNYMFEHFVLLAERLPGQASAMIDRLPQFARDEHVVADLAVATAWFVENDPTMAERLLPLIESADAPYDGLAKLLRDTL